MPALFALGQHAALAEVRRQLRPDECLLAYLDDIYVITSPERTRVAFDLLSLHLHRHAHIQLHRGKTRVWNASGLEPPGIRELGSVTDPVWVGDRGLPSNQQGLVLLLRHSSSSRGPSKISSSKASARSLTYSPLGCCPVHPCSACVAARGLAFAESHDAAIAACVVDLLGTGPLPDSAGGLNLRSGVALAPAIERRGQTRCPCRIASSQL